MELLKQQQELNRLLEQKQKQQDAENKQRRKKEELERVEARKKAQLREQQEAQLAKKLKQEQEEREVRKRRADEEERRKRQQQEAEARRYREYLEAREKAEKEAQEAKRRADEEARVRLERERAEKEAADKRKKEREAEEAAKYADYLRQKEELRKLLELKQKEDEAQQQRRNLVASQQQQRQTQTARANKLAQELRDRGGNLAHNWGAPIRARQAASSSVVTSSTSANISSTVTTAAPVGERRSQRARLVKKQRNSGDEKLIRQKIPLYSGPGQYGLYRGTNDTLANDLAALLDSVTLSPASSTSTGSSTSTSSTSSSFSSTGSASDSPSYDNGPSTDSSLQALGDRFESTTTRSGGELVTPSSLSSAATSSSLSPLLPGRFGEPETPSSSTVANELLFDDDVPRRPARGLTTKQQSQQPTKPISSSPTERSVSQTTVRQHRPSTSNETSAGRGRAHIGLASLPPDSDNDGIPGRAGVEYPVLSSVPPTSFSCSKQPLNGYYADTETACQVVHLCQAGVQSSILCPNGTIFNQEKFSCQWWYEVNCSRAPIFYQLNDNLYKSNLATADTDSKKQSKQSTTNSL